MFLLPPNILSGQAVVPPDGVFLLPVCTTREALSEIVHALDYYYRFHKSDYLAVKDVYNAALHINDPNWQCWIEPESPEQPEPTGAQQTDTSGCSCGCGSAVGCLGLSVHQLEDLLMSAICDIRIVDGVLEVLKFGCCDWQPIGSTGVKDWSRGGTGGTLIDQILGMDDHTLNQSPSIQFPPLPAAAQQGDLSQLGLSQCAKATAFADFIILYTAELAEAMDNFWDDVGIGLTFLGTATSIIASPVIGILVGDAMGLAFELAQNIPQADLAAITAWALNPDTRIALTCALLPAFYDSPEVSRVEIKRAWELIEDVIPNPINPAIYNAGKFIDADGFTDFIASEATAGRCACIDLLPGAGDLPAGALQILRAGLAQAVDPGDDPNDAFVNYAGNADPDAPYAAEQGALDGDIYAKTANLGAGNGTNNGGAVMYIFSENVSITNIKILWEVSGAASQATTIKQFLYRTSDAQWRVASASEDARSIGYHALDYPFTAVTPVNRCVVMFRNRRTDGSQSTGRIAELIFTGTLGGQAFSLRPGEIFTPA